MTAAETTQLLAAFAIVGVLLWALKSWDERRINKAIAKRYPQPIVAPPPRQLLSWEEKKQILEDDLGRAHQTNDTQDFMPFVGYLVAMSLGYRWLGWVGVLVGVPIGAALYYLIRAWIRRGRAKAARALAEHLQKDRSRTY